jgi:hypothetical protein
VSSPRVESRRGERGGGVRQENEGFLNGLESRGPLSEDLAVTLREGSQRKGKAIAWWLAATP